MQPRTTTRLLGLVAALGLMLGTGTLTADPALGAGPTYFVSTSGNDANVGSSAAPWRSIVRAVAAAPAGATIRVRAGTYGPFVVTKGGQAVEAAPGQAVVVAGRAGVRDVIRIAARGVRLTGMTVRGCVPDASPPGGFEDGGSSAIRVDDGAVDATIESMTIRDSRATNPAGLPFGCYGVFVHNANRSVISGNDISGTGGAVYINGGGVGASIAGNRLHDNDVIIRNTMRENDDFGGNAVAFSNLYGYPGPRATGNDIYNNAGPSHDYGSDGGAFEIYNASNVLIDGNALANNENVVETGTDSGGDCTGNSFSGNEVRGRSAGSELSQTIGLILRCASGMKVENNTFSGLEQRLFYIAADDIFSSTVDGLTIRNNTVTASDPVFYLGADPDAAGLVIDDNRYRSTGTIFASYANGSSSATLRAWRTRTGLDQSSTTF